MPKTKKKIFLPFLTNRNFLFFSNWEILVKKFVVSYSKNSWKHVVSSIIVPPKMNTLVGLIRITNFASATTVVFILVMAVMQEQIWKQNPMQNILSSVQLIFLSLMALLVYIDSIGTVSFCWREYGELSALHTDATSIMYKLITYFYKSCKYESTKIFQKIWFVYFSMRKIFLIEIKLWKRNAKVTFNINKKHFAAL